MMLKSAILATVLAAAAAAAAAGTATTASAAPATAPASWSVQEAAKQIHDVRWRRHTRTVVRCVRGRRVLMRINWRGRVVSRNVIGRCWRPYHRRHGHRGHRGHRH